MHRDGWCKYSLDFDINGLGAVYDLAGFGAVLRRPGALDERPFRLDALFRHCLYGFDHLVGGGI